MLKMLRPTELTFPELNATNTKITLTTKQINTYLIVFIPIKSLLFFTTLTIVKWKLTHL